MRIWAPTPKGKSTKTLTLTYKHWLEPFFASIGPTLQFPGLEVVGLFFFFFARDVQFKPHGNFLQQSLVQHTSLFPSHSPGKHTAHQDAAWDRPVLPHPVPVRFLRREVSHNNLHQLIHRGLQMHSHLHTCPLAACQ